MTSIVANKSMLTALKRVKGRTEIRDMQGQVIGTFTPKNLDGPTNHAGLPTRVDIDENQRRKLTTEKPIPSSEVLRHMRLLDAEIERRIKAGERKLTNDEAVDFVRRLRSENKGRKNR